MIWRSIWNARDLIKECIRWRVGDGKKIQIWGHKWLNTPSSFSVQSPITVLREDSKVAKLLIDDRREWNEKLVNAVFEKEEAEQILSIPLGRWWTEDKAIWGPSKGFLLSEVHIPTT